MVEAGQARTDAEVPAAAEGKVPVDRPAYVEQVGIRELPLVAIGGAVERRHLRAGGHDVAVSFHVAGRGAGLDG